MAQPRQRPTGSTVCTREAEEANLGVFTLQVLNSSSINKPPSNSADQRHVEKYFYNTYQLKVVLNWYSRGD